MDIDLDKELNKDEQELMTEGAQFSFNLSKAYGKFIMHRDGCSNYKHENVEEWSIVKGVWKQRAVNTAVCKGMEDPTDNACRFKRCPHFFGLLDFGGTRA